MIGQYAVAALVGALTLSGCADYLDNRLVYDPSGRSPPRSAAETQQEQALAAVAPNEATQRARAEVAAPPVPAPIPRPLYRFTSGHALTCKSLVALEAIGAPGAKERLGEVNYAYFLTRGDCAELDNHRPITICDEFSRNGVAYAAAAQYFGPGTVAACWAVRRSDLVATGQWRPD